MTDTLEQRFAPLIEDLLRTEQTSSFLVAVSGGADSVALLMLMHRLSASLRFSFSAVTVNHRIRSPDESSGDADYVERLCASLVPPVSCRRFDLAEGEVAVCAEDRKRGLEEAARHLRYRCFETAAREAGASRILTGHNLNDRLETTLMRFLQGAGGTSLSGIARGRGLYFRPLLDFEHAELCQWLEAQRISWREDATNSENDMLRNRIRNILVPSLNATFPGWKQGVLQAATRAALDGDCIAHSIGFSWTQEDGKLSCPRSDFSELHGAQKLALLQDGLIKLAVGHRVSVKLLSAMADSVGKTPGTLDEDRAVSGSGITFRASGDRVFFGPDIVQNPKSGYLVYITATGRYRLPFGEITLSGTPTRVYIDGGPGPFALPLVIRSRTGGDALEAGNGKRKTLKKLLNDWSVLESDRNLIPVIEEKGAIRAVLGSVLGYPDWYVRI